MNLTNYTKRVVNGIKRLGIVQLHYTLCTVIGLMQCTFSFNISKYELRQIRSNRFQKKRRK